MSDPQKIYNGTRREAERIDHSPRTLEGWRWKGTGPPYIKVGRRCLYDPAKTDAWLAERTHHSTSGGPGVERRAS